MLATAEAKRRGLRGDVILTAVADEEFASVGTEAVAATRSRGRRDRHRADRAAARRRAPGLRPSRGRGARACGARLAAAPRDRRDREDGPRPRRYRGARPAAAREPDASVRRQRQRARVADRRRAGVLELPGALPRSRPSGGRSPARRPSSPSRSSERSSSGAVHGDPDFSATVSVLPSRASRSRSEEDAEIVQSGAPAGRGSPRRRAGGSSASRSGPTRRSSRRAGIPTVLFGPLGEGAHAEVEWVDVASLERCVEIYVGVAAELCA